MTRLVNITCFQGIDISLSFKKFFITFITASLIIFYHNSETADFLLMPMMKFLHYLIITDRFEV